MRRLLALSISLLTLFAVVGCDDGPTRESGQEPPEQLSFAPVAGTWSGEIRRFAGDDTVSFPGTLTFEESALEGEKIGTFFYEGGNERENCSGDVRAVARDGDTYQVRERVLDGPCFAGTIMLNHSVGQNSEQLDYQWESSSSDATGRGFLTRAED